MKQKFLSYITLLAALLVGGVNSAWAETIATLGSNDSGWGSAYHDYTLSANKTLTLNFTVTSTAKGNETQGYFIQTVQEGVTKMMVQPGGGYNVNDKGWWNNTSVVKYDRSWVELSEFTNFAPESQVELTIQRIHGQILYFADITTKEGTRYFLRVLTSAIVDENKDLVVTLGADFAVLTGITDVTTDETITGTLIGKEDNSVDFNGEGAVSQAFTLGADKSLTLNFINYSSKIGWGDNWLLEIQNGSKYLDLRSDYFGWEAGMEGDEHYYVRTEDNTQSAYFTLTSSTGFYFDDFPKVLHKANVELTVARSGNIITVTAVQTCTNSVVKTQVYTLTHDDFATGDITIRLYAAYSHLDLLPATATIGEYGWATFSSDYALDFSKATTGLEAYMITGYEGTTVTTSNVTGTVPAGTGLLLKGDEGSYSIPVVGSSATDVSCNKLVPGADAAVAAEDGKTKYALSVEGGKAVFKKIVEGYSPNIAKGKAYLLFNEEVNAPTLSFDFNNPTGISEKVMVNSEKIANTPVYNLAGQRVAQPKKGLYIVNGKKIVK